MQSCPLFYESDWNTEMAPSKLARTACPPKTHQQSIILPIHRRSPRVSRTPSRVTSQQHGHSHSLTFKKTLSWRLVAGIDTVAVSYFVTGNPLQGLGAAVFELFTKAPAYYVHERAWNRVSFGRDNMTSWKRAARVVTKNCTYRLLAALDTFAFAYVTTGHAKTAATIMGTELLTKSMLYMGHEYGWTWWNHRQLNKPECSRQTSPPTPRN